MDSKVKEGIKSGVICGVLLIALSLANSVLYAYYVTPAAAGQQASIAQALSVLSLILVVCCYMFAGTLSSYFARADIRKRSDALVTGAVAGLVAGIIQIAQFLAVLVYSGTPTRLYPGGMDLTMTILTWFLLIILGVAVSALGAITYANSTQKLK
jgi:hypothetical protein